MQKFGIVGHQFNDCFYQCTWTKWLRSIQHVSFIINDIICVWIWTAIPMSSLGHDKPTMFWQHINSSFRLKNRTQDMNGLIYKLKHRFFCGGPGVHDILGQVFIQYAVVVHRLCELSINVFSKGKLTRNLDDLWKKLDPVATWCTFFHKYLLQRIN